MGDCCVDVAISHDMRWTYRQESLSVSKEVRVNRFEKDIAYLIIVITIDSGQE